MKTVAAFILINTILVCGQLVAALTVLTLAPLVQYTIHESHNEWAPWFAVMILAVAAALTTVKKAVEAL